MTEKQVIIEPVEAKEAKEVQQSQQPSSDTEFDEYHCQALDPESDFDLEEQYLNKLKIQRKRIEELSQLHLSNQQRNQRQAQKNRCLSEQILKLSSAKQYQSLYTEVISTLQISTQENKSLKEQLSELKQQNFHASAQKANLIQRLTMESGMRNEKYAAKIELLEDELANKQEDIDKMTRNHRSRERELQDSLSNFKSKMNHLDQEHLNQIKIEQRKVERLERDIQARHSAGNEAQLNADALLKESVQLKEENFRLTGQLNNKEMEAKSHYEKFKMKLSSIKKDLKSREKECEEFKESSRKYEKEVNQSSNETDTLRVEIRQIRDSFDSEKSRWESDFSKEKQSLQMVVDRQNSKIHELETDNKFLAEENKRLQIILRKKENIEKQRKYFLKTEMKDIDKLKKCIDKIVDRSSPTLNVCAVSVPAKDTVTTSIQSRHLVTLILSLFAKNR